MTQSHQSRQLPSSFSRWEKQPQTRKPRKTCPPTIKTVWKVDPPLIASLHCNLFPMKYNSAHFCLQSGHDIGRCPICHYLLSDAGVSTLKYRIKHAHRIRCMRLYVFWRNIMNWKRMGAHLINVRANFLMCIFCASYTI